MDPTLAQLQSLNQYLLVLVIMNGLLLVAVAAAVIGGWIAVQKAAQRAEQALAEWEPRLHTLEGQWEELRVKMLEQLDTAGTSMVRFQGLADKVEGSWDELAPQITELAGDTQRLVRALRAGVNDFQQSVVPNLQKFSRVATAVREGFGIFQQLRGGRPGDR